MSLVQTQRELNQIDNEIVILEKKRAELEMKESDRIRMINNVQRSITKHTSASTIASKNRQVQSYQNEIVKFLKDKADLTSKIAAKRKNRVDKFVKLQKEEVAERQKENRNQQNIQLRYEQRINDITSQINNQMVRPRQPYFFSGTNTEKYDVFISHAWEDKDDFVNEFVDDLAELGIKVWYDIKRITWGDSMRAKIDEGLAKSKFGIAIISPNYIAEGKYWTKTELDGIFQLESINGKTLLPIWHNITKKEVMEYSSILAGRFAMTTASMTSKEIAIELKNLLNPTDTDDSQAKLNEDYELSRGMLGEMYE